MPHCCFELEIGLRPIVCTARMTNVSQNIVDIDQWRYFICVNGQNDAFVCMYG